MRDRGQRRKIKQQRGTEWSKEVGMLFKIRRSECFTDRMAFEQRL